MYTREDIDQVSTSEGYEFIEDILVDILNGNVSVDAVKHTVDKVLDDINELASTEEYLNSKPHKGVDGLTKRGDNLDTPDTFKELDGSV